MSLYQVHKGDSWPVDQHNHDSLFQCPIEILTLTYNIVILKSNVSHIEVDYPVHILTLVFYGELVPKNRLLLRSRLLRRERGGESRLSLVWYFPLSPLSSFNSSHMHALDYH